MRIYFILFFSIFQFSDVTGQVLIGKITAKNTGEVLPGVIINEGDSIGTLSDSTGHYRLPLLFPGKHHIVFSLISFKKEGITLTFSKDETIEINIELAEQPTDLGVVVISAGKFEQRLEDVTISMEVLKPKLIESRNSTSMEEAVDYIPGVNILDGQANIRGGSGWSYGAGSRVQVLVDDLPQLTADANDVKWNFLPLENLEQVEVIKGASSVLFGSSALNGVINVRTAYPRDTPITKINCFMGFYDNAFITTDKKYSLGYQDKQSFYSGINFFHSRKIKRLDLAAGGNFFDDNGYRQGENEKRGRLNINTRYNFDVPGLSAGVNINSMITKSTLFFLWKNDTSGAYIPASNTLSDSKTNRTNIDPYVTYLSRGGSSHKIRTRWFNTINENNTNQNSTGNLFYTEYQYQKHFNNAFTLTTGLVNIYSSVKSELYQDHDGNQRAGYIQTDVCWRKFVFSAGARAEQNRVDDVKDKWTPVFRTGLNYHAFKESYIRASAGQAYRFPSIAERFISTSVSGVNIFPNPDLQPENGLSLEVGLKQGFLFGRFRGYVDAAIFENDYEDMIEFVFAQWATDRGFFLNNGFKSITVGNTRIRGFEITLMVEGELTNEIKIVLQGGYTYLDPRQITYDSAYVNKIGPDNVMGSDSTDFLKYRYSHMVRGDIEISRNKLSIGVSLRYTSRMENIDKIFVGGLLDLAFPPGLGIGDYRKYHNHGDMVIDLRTSITITKNVQISLIVKNVFNYIYMQRPGDMQPPRVFALQGSFKF